MNNKLWQTNTSAKLHPLIESYTVGDDYQIDQQLLGYDIQASKAHARMLKSVDLLTAKELSAIIKCLDKLFKDWQNGTFTIKKDQEDGHTAIEAYLVEHVGDAGKKIHTARSRNDQALTMMRLYLKEHLQRASATTNQLIAKLRKAAAKAGKTPMPGYTHMQRAIPTSVESWLLSYSDALVDAKHLIDSTLPIIDQNPLGSAAGFEMTLPIDRQHTTKSLGFAKVQQSPMYCGLSRGFFELFAIQALNPLMVLAGKFAHDMLLFTTEEFGFFSLPHIFTTGSSIMPHKHNYDLFELMRAKANIFGTYSQQVQAVSSGVGSGYNRDLQLTKGITIQAFQTAQETMDVLCLVVPKLELHKQKLIKTISPEMNSVAKINDLVAQGIPFRDAYVQVKNQLDKSES